jgi:hypothetical protein
MTDHTQWRFSEARCLFDGVPADFHYEEHLMQEYHRLASTGAVPEEELPPAEKLMSKLYDGKARTDRQILVLIRTALDKAVATERERAEKAEAGRDAANAMLDRIAIAYEENHGNAGADWEALQAIGSVLAELTAPTSAPSDPYAHADGSRECRPVHLTSIVAPPRVKEAWERRVRNNVRWLDELFPEDADIIGAYIMGDERM